MPVRNMSRPREVVQPSPSLLKIGEFTRRTGKTARTIRYYEELGLLRPTEHSRGGFRLFRPEDVHRVELVDRLHLLGFSLEDIASIIRAYRENRTGEEMARKIRELLEKARDRIDERIALLRSLREEVDGALRFSEDCRTCGQHPELRLCSVCRVGSHQANVPFFFRSLL